ncbi:MAG: hypothetical protein H6668_13225 [Ardenticatenaceae bacterium]|nr:hypothetical protein [Ardenticatenaceae bacterium]
MKPLHSLLVSKTLQLGRWVWWWDDTNSRSTPLTNCVGRKKRPFGSAAVRAHHRNDRELHATRQ